MSHQTNKQIPMSITHSRRAALGQMAAAGALAAAPHWALAQTDRPLRLVLPNATGSGVDGITRAAQAALSKAPVSYTHL
jgi:tripartite-type tricarboxylate transporter receptor subunit TctC